MRDAELLLRWWVEGRSSSLCKHGTLVAGLGSDLGRVGSIVRR